MTDLDTLIDALELAQGEPGGMINYAIGRYMITSGHDLPVPSCNGCGTPFKPDFVSSVDAARMLVPEGVPWAVFSDGSAWVWPADGPMDLLTGAHAKAARPALALCIAALKARQ